MNRLILEGYLHKKGGSRAGRLNSLAAFLTRHNWKRRYFVVQQPFLRYYESYEAFKQGKRPQGELFLEGSTVREKPHRELPFGFAIKVKERGGEMALVASSQNEMESWINTIRYLGMQRTVVGPSFQPSTLGLTDMGRSESEQSAASSCHDGEGTRFRVLVPVCDGPSSPTAAGDVYTPIKRRRHAQGNLQLDEEGLTVTSRSWLSVGSAEADTIPWEYVIGWYVEENVQEVYIYCNSQQGMLEAPIFCHQPYHLGESMMDASERGGYHPVSFPKRAENVPRLHLNCVSDELVETQWLPVDEFDPDQLEQYGLAIY